MTVSRRVRELVRDDPALLVKADHEFALLLLELDEKGRRLALGAVARAAGDGGIGAVARLTGASWQTVADGAAELGSGDTARPGRVRRPGGGRKKLADSDPGLLPAPRHTGPSPNRDAQPRQPEPHHPATSATP